MFKIPLHDPGNVIPATLAMVCGGAIFAVTQTAPTQLDDFFGPGTQPGVLVDPIETSTRCDSCHGGYDEQNEPLRPWAASPMGQSMRDPLFAACLAIAEQDAAFAGDLCLRCHTPGGWLAGRSTPTDGSMLEAVDFEGVSCNFCHRMVDPQQHGNEPIEDAAILAALTDLPPEPHTGSFVVDPEDRRRGPFDLQSFNSHEWRQSDFMTSSNHCATCHDVSNPAFTRQPDGSYAVNDLGLRHPTALKGDMFPVERTFSEWSQSLFAQTAVDMGGRFGGNLTSVSSCQDCHMPDGTGRGASRSSRPIRDNLPTHHFNGGNTWIVDAVRLLYPDSETLLDDLSAAQSVVRAETMLTNASDLEVAQEGSLLRARVINMTGHKLPSGYPEGRRIWVNVRYFDEYDSPVGELGAYDWITADLDTASTVVYETKIGVDQAMSDITGVPVGPGFHFAVNNTIYKDNRIPPMGFTNAGFESVQAAPVGHAYADGQHWDDSHHAIPQEARRADVRVYYQLASKEYIEFLRDENVTNDAGDILYSVWQQTGMSEPVELDFVSIALTEVESCIGDITTTGATLPGQPGYGVPDGLANLDDLGFYLGLWLDLDAGADLTTTGATVSGQTGFGVPDGAVDFDDLGYFVNAWLEGCS